MIMLSRRASLSVPLTCALPLLAAYAPEAFRFRSACARSLHVFARRPSSDYAKVEVPDCADAADLKDAVCAKLQLGVSSDRVRLLREVEGGGPPIALDSRRGLQEQGVAAGCSVVAEELVAAAASAPPPLAPPHSFDAPLLTPLSALSSVLLGARPSPQAPPPPRLHAEALRSLHSTENQRMEALGALLLQAQAQAQPAAAAATPCLPLFHTQAHRGLLSVLAGHAGRLEAGSFVGLIGAPCRTLVGARGTGKSSLMRAFTLAAPAAFARVIPLYLSGAGLADGSHVLRAGNLRSIMAAAAQAWGVDLRAQPPGAQALEAALRASGLRMILLLDEFDELFTHAKEDALQQHILETLGRLQGLGDQSSGLFSVLLCGSSSSTYRLVCREDVEQLTPRFPLLRLGTPNLNSDKYERRALASATCAASGEVEGMLVALAASAPRGSGSSYSLPKDVRALARLLTFFVGATPRAVLRALQPGELLSLTVGSLPHALSRPPQLRTVQAAFRDPAALPLYQALLGELVAGNQGLRGALGSGSGSTSVSLTSLMDPTQHWEAAIRPLQWGDVREVWRRTLMALGQRQPQADESARLVGLVDELTDRHLLQLIHPPGGEEAEVWPLTAAQLVAAEARAGWVEGACERARELLAPLASALQLAQAAQALASGVVSK